jgi:hypothetical protein
LQDLQQEEADRPTVEILKRVNRQKPTFGESEKLQRQIARDIGGMLPSGNQVPAVIPHAERNLGRQRRMEIPDPDLDRAPASRPLGNKFKANRAMKIGDKVFIDRAIGKFTGVYPRLKPDDLLGEQRSYLRVGENTSRGIEISGGTIWASRFCRLAKSTGSRSKDML